MAEVDAAVQSFLDYLVVERGLSPNTVSAYGRDLAQFAAFLERVGVDLPEIGPETVLGFLAWMDAQQFARASVARKVTAAEDSCAGGSRTDGQSSTESSPAEDLVAQ